MRKLQLFVFLLLLNVAAMAQTKQVTGTVTDSKTGTPLASVTVRVKGKNVLSVADANGNFTIAMPAGSTTLEFDYIGYAAKEVEVPEGTSTLSVTMDQSANNATPEVVVTALGISKEARKLGYATTTVSGDQMNKARETNVALSLEGQVAGLNVHGTNGGPGGSARILLRGISSLGGGGTPLFVINGVPMDNSQRGSAGEWGGSDNGDGIGNLNPDDIESMTVLKGLSASALYGARAANGVILITTKSGKKGKMTVDYNANYVVDQAINNTDFQYVYGQGTGGTKPATASASLATARFAWGAKMDGSSFTGWNGQAATYSPYKDNIKDFYRLGPSFTNTVSVSGGSESGNYRLSLSNLDNNAIVQNSGLTRRTVDLSIDQKVTSKLDITVSANYIDQQDKNPPQLSDGPGNPNNGLFLAPNIIEKTLAPGYDPTTGHEVVFSDDNYVTNPYFVVNQWINDVDRKRLISSISAKYNFNSWIYLMGRMGYDHQNDRYLGITPTGTDYSYNSAGQSGSINLSNVQTSELNLDAILGITHKLTNDINLDATLGANARRNQSESIGISGGPFVVPYLYTPYNVVSYGRSYGYNKREVHSGFYSLDFTYKNLLTLSTTGRYDAYSTLYYSEIPKSQRNLFTPSVSGSFLFGELLKSSVLNYGKLRASFAQTSGEGSPYQTAVYYNVGNSINGVPTGSFNSTLPNLFLKPFTLSEFEVGAELKFYNSRLGVDVSYFNRKSKNEIMNATISPATGYTGSVIANGSIQNKGFEILLTGVPVRTRNFTWNTSLNITTLKNEVLKTDAADNNLSLGTYRPLNANTAFVVGMAGPQIMAHDYTYDSKGNIVVDGSGLPIQGDLKPFGSVLPTLYGGFKNDFTYKNFDLSILIDYNFGNKILSATKYYALYRGLDKETLVGRDNGIKVDGVYQDGSANTTTVSAEAYYQRLASISKVNVLNGDYIKLRQITLGYTINPKMPVFSGIQVSLVARNLVTLMKHSDNIDPENGFSSLVNYAGIEGTSLPSVRSFGINVNFKFKN
ncbi:MAG TPA: SusC/RagA family TonB-linked outer membrane protein [Chitinophagaceae bacterium]|nr:SusC/RagA family TonB-linked outer membrane protein [Chitinophagaceae bacterium]